MVYTYKARDKFGEPVWGSMESTAPELVAAHLREIGYFPIQVVERAEPLAEKWRGLFRRVKQKELIALSRQMATLFGAHLPLTVSLEAMEKQTENLVLRAVIVAIRQDISGGSSLSDAMKKHPKMFSELYVNMVKAGESSGTLDKVMARLAQLAEKEGDTRAKVKSATRYPVIVLSIIPLAFIALVTLVIPKFEGIFAKSKAALPLPTRILMAANQFVANYWYVMLGATLVAVVLIRRHLATERGKAQWDRLKIKLPIIGPLVLKGALSRFTRVFATLEASGVPILNTLAIASKTVGNHAISAVIDRVAESVKEGKGLGGPLRESEFFPPIVTQMISIGEESGEMEAMLMKVSDYYDAEVEEAVKGLVASIEPLLIVALAGVALLFAMGIFLPMWNLNTAFK
jgi:type II secretory pathway component PulF